VVLWVVALQVLGHPECLITGPSLSCSGWLLYCCRVVARVFVLLLYYCQLIARVFWVVAILFLVARVFRLLLYCCWVVVRMFWVVAILLPVNC